MRGISQRILQRTCVACRQVRPKPELMRLVRLPNGDIEIDTGGKRVGRGAYLCRKLECWEAGLKGSHLGYALRTTLTPDNREKLMRYGKDLLEESIGGKDK